MKVWTENGVVDMEVPAAGPPPSSSVLSGVEFLDLWKPEEVAAAMGADPILFFNALRAIAQNSINLNSPRLTVLLDRAVATGVLSRARADQIAAGIAPT